MSAGNRSRTPFYGNDLAEVHAEAFEALAEAAATTLTHRLGAADTTGTVLDLGCGAGPLSRRLVAEGYSTWGVDISAALIRLARSRLPEGAFTRASILDVALPSAVAVAAVGEVMNYATARDPEDLTALFQKVFAALEPGGVFLFDLAGPGRAGAGRGFSEGRGWAVGLAATEDGPRLTRTITTFRQMEKGGWRRSAETHRLRLWPQDEVQKRLAACGFEVELRSGYDDVLMPPALHVYLATKPR